jgi:hypothetical protein
MQQDNLHRQQVSVYNGLHYYLYLGYAKHFNSQKE